MFLAFGGIISIQDVDVTSRAEIIGALTTMSIFILLMSLGVWHVFRKEEEYTFEVVIWRTTHKIMLCLAVDC